jgi:hypothetical protein
MLIQRAASVLAVVFIVTGASAATPPPAKDCIRVWAVPRFNNGGYNHYVHISNACSVAADCVVTTDVNPEPAGVVAPAKGDVEINTFLGSPARVFVPHVECTMRAP